MPTVTRFRFSTTSLARIALIVGAVAGPLFLQTNLYAQSSPLTVQPSTGRVGIGNSNPGYPLDVNGTVNATSFRGDGSELTNLPSSGSSSLIHKVATDTTILGNSTVETALYSFSVPGGTLGTDNTLRLTLRGKITFWDGDTRRMTFRIKYGATTMSGGLVIQAGSSNNSNQAWTLMIELSGDGATNSQIMHAVGILDWLPSEEQSLTWKNNNGNTARAVHGTSTTDSVAAQDLVVTGEWSHNVGSGDNVTIEYAMLENLS